MQRRVMVQGICLSSTSRTIPTNELPNTRFEGARLPKLADLSRETIMVLNGASKVRTDEL
jgi:hypothetical protein